jgi:hypothetical protein
MLKLRLFSLAAVVLALGGAVNPLFTAPVFEPRSSDAAGVSIVVKPKPVEAGAKVWDFDIVMNTHIKSLVEDLTAVSVLVDGNGQRTKPIAWQGDKPGGHHRRGILQFPAPAGTPEIFELRMTGVGGVDLRTFRWETK